MLVDRTVKSPSHRFNWPMVIFEMYLQARCLFLCISVRCEDPLLSIPDDSVIAMGYHSLAVNGTVVTISCPSGLILNGPESVMCTHTGQWEPALSEVNCSKSTDTGTSSKKELT